MSRRRLFFNFTLTLLLLAGFADVSLAAAQDPKNSRSNSNCALAFQIDAPLMPVAPQVPKIKWSLEGLEMMTVNARNLFWHVGKHTRNEHDQFVPAHDDEKKGPRNKPEEHTARIRELIERKQPHLVVIQEVEKISALEHLASESLKGRYQAFILPGNDGRGLEIGFLVRTDLPISVRLETHKHLTFFDPGLKKEIPIFSRDLPVLSIYVRGRSQPELLLFGYHGKSQTSRMGDDGSQNLRRMQAGTSQRVAAEYSARFGAEVPIFFAGDFGADVREPGDLDGLLTQYPSAFDVAPQTVAAAERVTYTYISPAGVLKPSHLDDFRVSPAAQKLVKAAWIEAYRDSNGNVIPMPTTRQERYNQPSDHQAVMVRLGK